MATIQDVARKAKVSVATVSYVINGKEGQVSSETQARVRRVMSELDYSPSPFARGLKGVRSRTVAIVISQGIHPVQAFTVSAATAELMRHGYVSLVRDVAVHATDAQEARKVQEAAARDCIRRRVDGVIDFTGLTDSQIASLRTRKVPVVLVGRMAPAGLDADSVVVDSFRGGQLATSHLLEAGYKHIVCLHHRQPERVRGYEEALRVAGSTSARVIPDVNHPIAAYDALTRLTGEGTPVDAVFLTADREALGVYRAAEALGKRIPTELGVVGFDDTFAVFMSPGLTSVAQPLTELGYRAAAMLVDRLERPDRTPIQVTLAPRLTVRESTRLAGISKRQLLESVWKNDF